MRLRAAEPIRLQSFLTSAINVCDAGAIGDADLQTQPSFPDTGDLGPRPAPSDRDRPEFSGDRLRAVAFRPASSCASFRRCTWDRCK
jgi:hypothetical protein